MGSLFDDIAMTLQRYPTQNNCRFVFTKSADLYRATICWLLMRESVKFFEVGQIKINKCQRLELSKVIYADLFHYGPQVYGLY